MVGALRHVQHPVREVQRAQGGDLQGWWPLRRVLQAVVAAGEMHILIYLMQVEVLDVLFQPSDNQPASDKTSGDVTTQQFRIGGSRKDQQRQLAVATRASTDAVSQVHARLTPAG